MVHKRQHQHSISLSPAPVFLVTGDSLSYHNGKQFATFDKDINSCAQTYEGGFWFDYCHYSNPNGMYKWGNVASASSGISWHHWKGDYYSLKSVVMKIRRVFLPEVEQ